MSPRLMLSLWRERWGKAGDSSLKRPYLEGGLNRWSDRLMAAWVWSVPGALQATVLLSLFGLALLVTVDLSLNSQLVFAVTVGAISLYARRFGGQWVTLFLVGLSVIASVRYLVWRFEATLSPHLDMALVLGFALCAAELHLWFSRMVGWLADAFPLKRAPVPLPADPSAWPTLDIFIPCHGLSSDALERAAKAAQALDWPSQKIKRYLLDDSSTGTAQLLAASLGLIYLSTPGNGAGKSGAINSALPLTQGEWIVVFDGDCTADRHFLTSVGGWWATDSTLAMMQTATHFLAPTPTQRSLAVIGTPELGSSCAAIRRSALIRAGGVETEPVTAMTHTALKLQALGYSHAFIGFAPAPAQHRSHGQRATSATQPTTPLSAFRVDHTFSDRALYWKQRLSDFQAFLQFYRLVPLLIIFTAPLAYWLAQVNLIQTSAELLLAYFLPHWLQAYFAQSRFAAKARLTVLDELKELVLGLWVLLSTASSVTRAEGKRWLAGLRQSEKRPIPKTFDGLIAWPYALVLVLSLVGFMSGLVQSVSRTPVGDTMDMLYLAWVGYNLLLLAGILAVAQESEHIRLHAHQQSKRPATVRLPSGHAVPCLTENFPDTVLTLELSAALDLAQGSKLNVSIYRHDREYVFPADVVSCQEETLCVKIEEDVQPSYRSLGAAAFSRGPDWPKWLPDRNTDQPFPPWLIAAFGAVRMAALKLKKRLDELSWWLLFGGWVQKWKKR